MTVNHNVLGPQVIPVDGAFEDYEGTREHLITLTRSGQLLRVGDSIPAIPGVSTDGRPYILHTVNALGTPTCDSCVDMLEQFHIDHPEVPVYSITKQDIGEFDADNPDAPEVTHKRVRISEDTAIDLGIALASGENADAEFWPTALRRTLAVIDSDGRVIDIQQPDDQEEKPDFLRAEAAVLAAFPAS
jgi:hypothetical protein